MAPIRCVYCSLSAQSKFGQGEITRVLSSFSPESLPEWIDEHKPISNPISFVYSAPKRINDTQVYVAGKIDLSNETVSVNGHVSLDGFRRATNNEIIGIDGKPCLNGLPNAFFNSIFQPFGLIPEINDIGWPEPVDESSTKLELKHLVHAATPREGEIGSWIYFHHCCAAWSDNVQSDASSSNLLGVEASALQALGIKCSYCKKLGASVNCRVKGCTNYFHYPCCSASGCLQDLDSMEIVCPTHLLKLSSEEFTNTTCLLCEAVGDVRELIYCTGCGSHFHSTCLEPPLILSPTVRIGWQCAECKTCLVCCESKDENKMLVCDVCDKGYHTYCLNPPLSNLPKNGFKCSQCRVCLDCGIQSTSTTLQLQQDSDNLQKYIKSEIVLKWHNNYTQCDKCFHAKRKGNVCSVCYRSWRCCLSVNVIAECIPRRLASLFTLAQQQITWQGRRCVKCKKMVHHQCDPLLQTLDPSNLTIEYVCITCKSTPSIESPAQHRQANSPQPSIEATESSCGGDCETASFVGDDYPLSIGSKDAQMTGISVVMSSIDGGIDSQSLPDGMNSGNAFFNTTPVNNHSESHLEINSLLGKPQSPGEASSLVSSPHSSSTHTSSVPPSTNKNNCKRTRNKNQAINRKRTSNSKNNASSNGPTSAKVTNAITNTGCNYTKTVSMKRSITNYNSSTSNSSNTTSLANRGDPYASRNRRAKTRKGTLSDPKNLDDRDDHTATIVICSANDKFTLEQDICLSCGSFGLENNMLACAQCGQCFHTFCADVSNVGQTILERGWRCLDCTVCEGCGENRDENLLLLCDDCDISYHTYCLNPSLKEVPKGGWKCSNCVACVNCGRKDVGPHGKWYANYTLCHACASIHNCPVCTLPYKEADLLVRCSLCTCWSHAGCDNLKTEAELDAITENGYQCVLCRDFYGRMSANKLLSAESSNGICKNAIFPDSVANTLYSGENETFKPDDVGNPESLKLFFMDGVVLTEIGLKNIRSSLQKTQAKRQSGTLNKKNSLKSNDEISSRHGDNEDSQSLPPNDGENLDTLANALDTNSNIIKSPMSNSQISDEETASNVEPSANVAHPSNKNQKLPNGKNAPRNRRSINVGVGGFRARTTRATIPKKNNINCTVSPQFNSDSKSQLNNLKKRCGKKKSEIEENYPEYLMQAFYGDSLASAKLTNQQQTTNQLFDGFNMKEETKPGRLDEVMHSIIQKKQTSPENTQPNKTDKIDSSVKASVPTVLDQLLLEDDQFIIGNPLKDLTDEYINPEHEQNEIDLAMDSSKPLISMDARSEALFDKEILEIEDKKLDNNKLLIIGQESQMFEADLLKKEDFNDKIDSENMEIAGDQWIKIVNDFIADMGDESPIVGAHGLLSNENIVDDEKIDEAVAENKFPSFNTAEQKSEELEEKGSDFKDEKPVVDSKSNIRQQPAAKMASEDSKIGVANLCLPELSLTDIETQLGPLSEGFDMLRDIHSGQQQQQQQQQRNTPTPKDGESPKPTQKVEHNSGSKPPTPIVNRPSPTNMGPPISQSPVLSNPSSNIPSPRQNMGPPTPQSANRTVSPMIQHPLTPQRQESYNKLTPSPQNQSPHLMHQASSLPVPMTQPNMKQNQPQIPQQLLPAQVQPSALVGSFNPHHQTDQQSFQMQQQIQRQNLTNKVANNQIINQALVDAQKQQQQIHSRINSISPHNIQHQQFYQQPHPQQQQQQQQNFYPQQVLSQIQGQNQTNQKLPTFPRQQLAQVPINGQLSQPSYPHNQLFTQQHQNLNQTDHHNPSQMIPGWSNQRMMIRQPTFQQNQIQQQQQPNQASNHQQFYQAKIGNQFPHQQFFQGQMHPGQFSPKNVQFPQQFQPQQQQQQQQQRPTHHQQQPQQQQQPIIQQQPNPPPISYTNHAAIIESPQCSVGGSVGGNGSSGIMSPEFNQTSNQPNSTTTSTTSSSNSATNKRINLCKWEDDEKLGVLSTIAPVLYANSNMADLKTQYPDFQIRAKEISKIWRRLSSVDRQKWVTQARNNRVNMKSNPMKQQKTPQQSPSHQVSRSGNVTPNRFMADSPLPSGQQQQPQQQHQPSTLPNSSMSTPNPYSSAQPTGPSNENKQRLVDLLANNNTNANNINYNHAIPNPQYHQAATPSPRQSSESHQISSNPSPVADRRAASVGIEDNHTTNNTPQQTPNANVGANFMIKSPASLPSKLSHSASTPVVHYSDSSSLADVPSSVGEEKNVGENSIDDSVLFEPPVIVSQVQKTKQQQQQQQKTVANHNTPSVPYNNSQNGSYSNPNSIQEEPASRPPSQSTHPSETPPLIQSTQKAPPTSIMNVITTSSANCVVTMNSTSNPMTMHVNTPTFISTFPTTNPQTYQQVDIQAFPPYEVDSFADKTNQKVIASQQAIPQAISVCQPNIWGHGHALPFQQNIQNNQFFNTQINYAGPRLHLQQNPDMGDNLLYQQRQATLLNPQGANGLITASNTSNMQRSQKHPSAKLPQSMHGLLSTQANPSNLNLPHQHFINAQNLSHMLHHQQPPQNQTQAQSHQAFFNRPQFNPNNSQLPPQAIFQASPQQFFPPQNPPSNPGYNQQPQLHQRPAM